MYVDYKLRKARSDNHLGSIDGFQYDFKGRNWWHQWRRGKLEVTEERCNDHFHLQHRKSLTCANYWSINRKIYKKFWNFKLKTDAVARSGAERDVGVRMSAVVRIGKESLWVKDQRIRVHSRIAMHCINHQHYIGAFWNQMSTCINQMCWCIAVEINSTA